MRRGRDACGPWNRFQLVALEPKTVKSRGAVSPMATAMPRSTAVRMPELAVGSTTDHTVRHCGAPSAADASRRSLGTIFRTSSVPRVTVGRSSTAKASAPANPENPGN